MTQLAEIPPVAASQTQPNASAADDRPAVLTTRFRWYMASIVRALFVGALFDQVLRPEIAAALEVTGRIRFEPLPRGARSAASDQLVLWGDAADRLAETERLVRLHREVRGTDPGGVRYSALAPESWNWILISVFLWLRNSFVAITGEDLTSDDDETLWQYFVTDLAALRRSGLPASYESMVTYYESVLDTRAERCDLLDKVVSELRRPPPPPLLPRPLHPLWRLAAPALGRGPSVLSFGIMHPRVRELAGIRWGRAQQLEFNVLTTLVGVAYRSLPRRMHYSPLAYNRWRYERLTARYKRLGLESFRPDEGS
jgi:uncharacterized protein (DUF2236 family)